MKNSVVEMLIKELHVRKNLTVDEFYDEIVKKYGKYIVSKKTVERILSLANSPYPPNIELLLKVLGASYETYVSPYLSKYDPMLLTIRNKLLIALNMAEDEDDGDALAAAERLLLDFMSISDKTQPESNQLILCCKARILTLSGGDADETISLITDGMKITYPEFDVLKFSGEILFAQEITLLHSLALSYEKSNRHSLAASLLESLLISISHLPQDADVSAKTRTKVLFSLTRLYLKLRDYIKSLEASTEGKDLSISYDIGRYTPTFLYAMAISKFNMNDSTDDEINELFHSAYHGYKMFEMEKSLQNFVYDVKDKYGLEFNDDHIKTAETSAPHTTLYSFDFASHSEKNFEAQSIGELIHHFRVEKGISRKELYYGVSTSSHFSKVEKGETTPNIYVLEHYFQRLGLDKSKYINPFLPAKIYYQKKLRDNIRDLLSRRNYKEARIQFRELEESMVGKSGIGLQILADIESVLLSYEIGYKPQCYDTIIKGLCLTLQDFNVESIDKYRLTYNEICLINMLGIYYYTNKEKETALKVFANLKTAIENTYTDEREKRRMLPTVIYNYTKFLGQSGMYEEALPLIEEGLLLARKWGMMKQIPGLLINKACDLLELGKIEESKPLFAQAYYGFSVLGRKGDKDIIASHVKDRLGIVY